VPGKRRLRVAFFGDVEASATILEYLVGRSSDRRDPVELTTVVSPRRFRSHRVRRSFELRRTLDTLIARPRVRSLDSFGRRTISSTTAVLAQRARATVCWPDSLGDPDTIRIVQDARALLRWLIERRGPSRLTLGVRSDRCGEFVESCRDA
jgi:hypothetical protein